MLDSRNRPFVSNDCPICADNHSSLTLRMPLIMDSTMSTLSLQTSESGSCKNVVVLSAKLFLAEKIREGSPTDKERNSVSFVLYQQCGTVSEDNRTAGNAFEKHR